MTPAGRSGPWWWRRYEHPINAWERWHPLVRYAVLIGIVVVWTPAAILIERETYRWACEWIAR